MLLCLGALSSSLASLGVEFPLIPFSVGSDGPAGPEHHFRVSFWGKRGAFVSGTAELWPPGTDGAGGVCNQSW